MGKGDPTRARRFGASISGRASIIVPCFNQQEFTRLCIQALFRHTRAAWELIVVDNGSTDDTAADLAGVQHAAPVPVTVIRNSRNLGFPAAINQGLQVAEGDYFVLLNNDAVVTEGWLDQLLALSSMPRHAHAESKRVNAETAEDAERKPEDRDGEERGGSDRLGIGLVGPMSNYAPPPQWVEEVPYRDIEEMHRFAGRWRDEHRGQWFNAAKLAGFCVLIKRAVYKAIGGLDERFGLRFFDDDDLAVRARCAGFELAVTHDLFVHHFGNRTFAGNGIDAQHLLEANARRFADKWGREAPAGRPVSLRPWRGEESAEHDRQEFHAATPRSVESAEKTSNSAGSGASTTLRVKPVRTARVSLTMIVKDEQENLPRCLGSVRGIFDEVVVVDTGSSDRTREIARESGAKVFEFAWIDDFAAARNAALGRATGDYAFWLDADDVIEPDRRGKLVALLDGLASPDRDRARTEPRPPGAPRRPGTTCPPEEENPAAYVARRARDPGEDGSGGKTVVDHIRLFPLRPDDRWTYRVHEQILPALRRAGIPVRWSDLVVRHTGYVDVALRARKLERDRRILLEELKDRPDEPFLLFNLGAIAIERRDWAGALGYLRRSLRSSAPTDSITRKLFALIARAHQMLGDSGAALRVCAEGLRLGPEDAELWFRKAVVHRNRGESAEAERCWRAILGLRRPEKFVSVDMGIYGHVTRRNLAAERGDRDEASRLWRAVLVECHGDHEALRRLEALASNPQMQEV
jgi:glycosyltransferase involved in cell wall biosynthesis